MTAGGGFPSCRALLERCRAEAVRMGGPDLVPVDRMVMSEPPEGGVRFSVVTAGENRLRSWRGWEHEVFPSEGYASDALRRAAAAELVEGLGDGVFWRQVWSDHEGTFDEDRGAWVDAHVVRRLVWAYVSQLATVRAGEPSLAESLLGELVRFAGFDGTPHRLRLYVTGVDPGPAAVAAEGFEVRRLDPEETGVFVDPPSGGRAVFGPWRPSRGWSTMVWPTALLSHEFDGSGLAADGGVSATDGVQRFLVGLFLQGFAIASPQPRADIQTFPHWLGTGVLGTAPLAVRPLEVMPAEGQAGLTEAHLRRAADLARRVPAGAWRQPGSARDVVFHRYMQGYSRRQDVDRILDFTVALESCLVRTNSELRHRFALYGAQFLGADGEDRLELKDRFARLYDLRSKLAHGSKFPSQEEIARGARDAQTLCERVLVKCLDEGWPADGALDEALLS